MIEVVSKYRCPACDKEVLNRAVKHCLYCGANLPSDFLFSDEKIARMNKELNWTSSLQQKNQQIGVNRLKADLDIAHSEPRTTAGRSDATTVMDAIAGGLIGFVVSVVLLLLVSKRASWLSPWLCFWFVFACTSVSSIGSYVFGAAFVDRILFQRSRK